MGSDLSRWRGAWLPGLPLVGFGLGILSADRRFRPTGPAAIGPVERAEAVGGVVGVAGELAELAGTLRSTPWSAWEGVAALALALLLGLGVLALASRRPDARVLATTCVVLVVSFLAGQARLEARLVEAAEDARRVEREAGGAREVGGARDRVVEAEVVSRRSTRWGDEVLLEGVRAVDSAGPVPRRLVLRVRDPTRFSAGAVARDAEAVEATPRARRLLREGVRARMALRIDPLRAQRNPGTPDRERDWARRGFAARARMVDPDWLVVVDAGDAGAVAGLGRLRGVLEHARSRWVARVAACLSGARPGAGLVRALGLGDRSGLSEPLVASFRRLGLSHLIAVSGLHVGLVGGLVAWLVAQAIRRTLGTSLARAVPLAATRLLPFGVPLFAAAVSGAAYAWLTGAATSALRAALLLGLFVSGRLARRGLEPGEALGWAALLLLAWQPASLFDLGARLSFGACAALIVGGFWRGEQITPKPPSRISGWRDRVVQTFTEGFWGSLAVSLVTGPLVLAAGMPLSLTAPLLNLVAIPWTGGVVLPASLAATLAAPCWPDALTAWLLGPAAWTEWAALRLAEGMPRPMPLDGLTPGLAAALGVLGVLGIRWGRRSLALLAWGILAGLGAPPAPTGSGWPTAPRVVFFDMGQGDAALVEGESARLLVDTGGGPFDGSGGDALVRALRAIGVSRLDAMVVSHGDLDHRGGGLRVLERLRVAELWLPSGGAADPRLADLASAARLRGVRVRWLGARPDPIPLGDLRIDVLWPSDPEPARPTESSAKTLVRSVPASARRSWNEASLVVRVTLAGQRVLFAADIGAAVERRLLEAPLRLEADLLKVGHHGSRKSTTPAFLEAVAPSFALLSAPCDPARGLPTDEVLERLVSAGVRIGWTGRDGALALGLGRAAGSGVGDEAALDVRGWGASRRCRGSSSGR